MKYLFIVQGEGRGHLTQAIALEEMLLRRGHEVVEVLVGESSWRRLPGFFNRSIQAPVKRFVSPNFLPSANQKRMQLTRSVLYNLMRVPEYLRSMRYIDRRIKETGAEVVVNFYELLTGFTYALFRPDVPQVCIGHQYLFLHSSFEFPQKDRMQLCLLRLFTRLTAIGASRRLALSFCCMEHDETHRIAVVPPLIRREVLALQPEAGNHILGYMVNAGFANSVRQFHTARPEVPMTFFWDKADEPEVLQVDGTLSFHQIDDVKFLDHMARCKAYASTAGFESVCEAMYLGKPVWMVPVHIEQDCNAHDAVKAGAGMAGEAFDLKALLRFAKDYKPNREFARWACAAERLLMTELEHVADQPSGNTAQVSTLPNYMPI